MPEPMRPREQTPSERTLLECLRFFVHRDRMNAAVHVGEVRYSPLTFRVAGAIVSDYPDTITAVDMDVRAVLADVGAYQEDTGR